jgi:ketosteroid isomerase-like protein
MSDNPIIDAWNSGDAANLAPLYADDAVRHHCAHPETRLDGKDAIIAGVGAILHAIPDAVVTNRSLEAVADGRILIEWTFAGTA